MHTDEDTHTNQIISYLKAFECLANPLLCAATLHYTLDISQRVLCLHCPPHHIVDVSTAGTAMARPLTAVTKFSRLADALCTSVFIHSDVPIYCSTKSHF